MLCISGSELELIGPDGVGGEVGRAENESAAEQSARGPNVCKVPVHSDIVTRRICGFLCQQIGAFSKKVS
jgi:hypothetical protein